MSEKRRGTDEIGTGNIARRTPAASSHARSVNTRPPSLQASGAARSGQVLVVRSSNQRPAASYCSRRLNAVCYAK